MDIGLITAFLGGVLAILSPCGALLLPAFFASTVGAGPRLLLHGVIFFVGLLLVLVPIGVGAGAVGTLFGAHRTLIITVAAIILIVLGLLQILGLGFDPARAIPGTRQLQHEAATRVGIVKTLLLGAVSGVAGFCAGPILGAVLTLAAAQGSLVIAGMLLAVYGAGMVVPLIIIAALWGRIGDRVRGILRGRSFTVLGRELHSTSVITGVLIVTVGIVFWATNGLVSMPNIVPTSVLGWLQGQSSVLARGWLDALVIVLLAGLSLFWWFRAAGRVRAERTENVTQSIDLGGADE